MSRSNSPRRSHSESFKINNNCLVSSLVEHFQAYVRPEFPHLIGLKSISTTDFQRIVRRFQTYTTAIIHSTSSEDAVEYDELDIFLRLKETWNTDIDEHIAPPAAPIGVPGAAMPLEMTPERLRDKPKFQPTASPLSDKKPIPVNKREGELDLGEELSGFGLQGLKATEDELRDLIADLGLDGDDAGDLLKGLSGDSAADEKDKVDEEEEERPPSPSPDKNVAKATSAI